MSRIHFWISSQGLLIAVSICSWAKSSLGLKSSSTSQHFQPCPSLPLYALRAALISRANQSSKTRSPVCAYGPSAPPFSLQWISLKQTTPQLRHNLWHSIPRRVTLTHFLLHVCSGTEASDNRLLYLRCWAIKPLEHNLLSLSHHAAIIKISQIKILNLQAKGGDFFQANVIFINGCNKEKK